MQNNIQQFTLAYFIYSKKQTKKNMLGIKTLILLHLTTERPLLSQTRLSFKNRDIANPSDSRSGALSVGPGVVNH